MATLTCLHAAADRHPSGVMRQVLIDPVAMLTCHPQLLATFVYKHPDVGALGSLLGVVDSARFLFSRDLTIADAFCRKFVWHQDCLWPQVCILALKVARVGPPSQHCAGHAYAQIACHVVA